MVSDKLRADIESLIADEISTIAYSDFYEHGCMDEQGYYIDSILEMITKFDLLECFVSWNDLNIDTQNELLGIAKTYMTENWDDIAYKAEKSYYN